MNNWKILEKINVLNYDDGKSFTVKHRLDVICNLLSESEYRLIGCKGLFHLYGKKPLNKLGESIVVLSTHIDCQRNITKCFSEVLDNGLLKGTYDNSITNGAVVQLMLENKLADNVVVAFTGDEEVGAYGVCSLDQYLDQYNKKFWTIVLDVTSMGWNEEADFTVENNFWNEKMGKAVVKASIETGHPWNFVPSNPEDIPAYVPQDAVIPVTAQPDESWQYNREGISCFSLCIPVEGWMHCNDGVLARQQAFDGYRIALQCIANQMAKELA